MKLLTIIGARPQFIKASVVSRAFDESDGFDEIIVHSGQHYDNNMSETFFGQLDLPRPKYNLDINRGSHGHMTGRMLMEIEGIIQKEKPDRLLVYGDTNTTLAGALAAIKLHVPVAHVEAGLRSFNLDMPEEVNRILTDQISDVLFCPTAVAVQNLREEGFDRKSVEILNVGDVMQDCALFFSRHALPPREKVPSSGFILATLHREENTDNKSRLTEIVNALNKLHEDTAPVVIPLHPRTKHAIAKHNLSLEVHAIDPVGYLEMIWLLQHCALVATDSGGVQKESFFFGKPCVTMRDETEWVELVESGANRLAGANCGRIVEAVVSCLGCNIEVDAQLYGGGDAAKRIAAKLSATDSLE